MRMALEVAAHLVAVLLGPADHVLFGVDPVELLVQRVVVDGPHVPQAVDGQDNVGALLLVNHHTVDGRLLAEEQEGGGSCRGRRRAPFSDGEGLRVRGVHNEVLPSETAVAPRAILCQLW